MVAPDAFSRLPLLADGNPVCALRRAVSGSAAPVEALNQSRPEAVAAVHAAQARAGAELLRTNTAGAGAAALAPYALAERAEALNNSGSALARQALTQAPRGSGFVMGTLGAPPRPGLVDDPAWSRAFGEQVIYLSDTGVDFFLLHHVSRFADAREMTRRIVRASDAPVLAALRVDVEGRTVDGVPLAEAFHALADEGAGALGLSCEPGPAGMPTALAVLLDVGSAHGLPVAVLAGIGVPGTEGPGPGAPRLDPAGYAAWLAPLAVQGVAILGGCCGVTPDHTRALALALGRETGPARDGADAVDDV